MCLLNLSIFMVSGVVRNHRSWPKIFTWSQVLNNILSESRIQVSCKENQCETTHSASDFERSRNSDVCCCVIILLSDFEVISKNHSFRQIVCKIISIVAYFVNTNDDYLQSEFSFLIWHCFTCCCISWTRKSLYLS